jgi:YidC/Oxa1 family membrane protein insertase
MEQKSPFDGRTIVIIVICMGIWWAWQQYLEKKYPGLMGKPAATSELAQKENPNEGTPQTPTSPGVPVSQAALSIPNFAKTSGVEKKWVYENDLWRLVVSSFGGRVSDVQLKKFTDHQGKMITLISPELPGVLLTSFDGKDSTAQGTNIEYKINPISAEKVELVGQTPTATIKKTLTVDPDKYVVKTHIVVQGKLDDIQRVNIDAVDSAPLEASLPNKAMSFLTPGPAIELKEYYMSHGGKHARDKVTSKDIPTNKYEQTHFAALGTRYFTTLLFNRGNVLPEGQEFRVQNNSVLRLSYPVLERSSPLTYDLDLYVGPKSLKDLAQIDQSATEAVDFGMFSIIALPLLQVMRWFYSIFANWGLAIIALTILVRLITFPFTYVSYKSMKAMQKIQPEIARLKEIYKDNTQQLNQEMLKLMRDNKVNPMGGCVPMLLQLPVFWALYQVLQNSIELYHAPFFGWIHDLSLKDPYYVLPVLMGIVMFIQQKLTPNTMDPAQAKVMLFMPVIFSFIMLSVPSGLTLYIFVSTLFGIIQQVAMMRDRAGNNQVVVRRA